MCIVKCREKAQQDNCLDNPKAATPHWRCRKLGVMGKTGASDATLEMRAVTLSLLQ